MVNNVDKKLDADYRYNPVLTIQSPIDLFRSIDISGALIAGLGYATGDQNMMLAGMALYQANTGNRA